ncbi:hypothetical protein ADUPG1_010586, partial [Aduncisulcus paluster]
DMSVLAKLCMKMREKILGEKKEDQKKKEKERERRRRKRQQRHHLSSITSLTDSSGENPNAPSFALSYLKDTRILAAACCACIDNDIVGVCDLLLCLDMNVFSILTKWGEDSNPHVTLATASSIDSSRLKSLCGVCSPSSAITSITSHSQNPTTPIEAVMAYVRANVQSLGYLHPTSLARVIAMFDAGSLNSSFSLLLKCPPSLATLVLLIFSPSSLSSSSEMNDAERLSIVLSHRASSTQDEARKLMQKEAVNHLVNYYPQYVVSVLQQMPDDVVSRIEATVRNSGHVDGYVYILKRLDHIFRELQLHIEKLEKFVGVLEGIWSRAISVENAKKSKELAKLSGISSSSSEKNQPVMPSLAAVKAALERVSRSDSVFVMRSVKEEVEEADRKEEQRRRQEEELEEIETLGAEDDTTSGKAASAPSSTSSKQSRQVVSYGESKVLSEFRDLVGEFFRNDSEQNKFSRCGRLRRQQKYDNAEDRNGFISGVVDGFQVTHQEKYDDGSDDICIADRQVESCDLVPLFPEQRVKMKKMMIDIQKIKVALNQERSTYIHEYGPHKTRLRRKKLEEKRQEHYMRIENLKVELKNKEKSWKKHLDTYHKIFKEAHSRLPGEDDNKDLIFSIGANSRHIVEGLDLSAPLSLSVRAVIVVCELTSKLLSCAFEMSKKTTPQLRNIWERLLECLMKLSSTDLRIRIVHFVWERLENTLPLALKAELLVETSAVLDEAVRMGVVSNKDAYGITDKESSSIVVSVDDKDSSKKNGESEEEEEEEGKDHGTKTIEHEAELEEEEGKSGNQMHQQLFSRSVQVPSLASRLALHKESFTMLLDAARMDAGEQMTREYYGRTRPILVTQTECEVCGKTLAETGVQLKDKSIPQETCFVFQCGHAVHRHCLPETIKSIGRKKEYQRELKMWIKNGRIGDEPEPYVPDYEKVCPCRLDTRLGSVKELES